MRLEPLAMVNGFVFYALLAMNSGFLRLVKINSDHQRHSFHIVQVPFQSMQILLSYPRAKNADRQLFSFI